MNVGGWYIYIAEEGDDDWSVSLSFDSSEFIIERRNFKSEKDALQYAKRQLNKMGEQLILLSKKVK